MKGSVTNMRNQNTSAITHVSFTTTITIRNFGKIVELIDNMIISSRIREPAIYHLRWQI